MPRRRTYFSNRWLLRQAAALFGAAVALSGIMMAGTVAQFLAGQTWFPIVLDQGWATLLGAVAGLSIVGAQASVGFQRLRQSQAHQAQLSPRSQEDQAELDREARRDQFDLQVRHEERGRLAQRKATAAALNGELLAVHAYLSNRNVTLRYQRLIYESLPPQTLIPTATISLIGAKTPIFDKALDQMGLFEPSLISDLIEVFQAAKANVDAPADKIEARNIAKMYMAIIDGWADTHEDFLHLQRRLVAIQHDQADPGSLFFARQERKKASSSNG